MTDEARIELRFADQVAAAGRIRIMSEYKVTVIMSRPLTDDQIRRVAEAVTAPLTEIAMDGKSVVMVTLEAEDAMTAPGEASRLVSEAAGVVVNSTQLLP